MVKPKVIAKSIILAAFVAWTLFPLYWIVSMSIKLPTEWTARPPVWIPTHLNFENYRVLFAGTFEFMPGLKYTILPATPFIINSFIIAGVATVVAIISGFMAAYSISRFKTGGAFLILFVLCTRMFPGFGIAIPLVVMFSSLGLMDTHIALILIYAGVTMVFAVLMMKSFIDDIPKEVEEAAMLDGYSTFGRIFKVVLPLVKGGLAATALFIFILNWGEFFFALIFSHVSTVTMPVQLERYFVSSGILYGPVSALGVIGIIPVIILTYVIQKHLVAGLTFGAVKGRGR